MTDIDALERMAHAAEGADMRQWWTEHSLRYHLRVADGVCPEEDPPLIAACDPSTVLRLIAVYRAAQAVQERHSCGESNGVWAALRAALLEVSKP